MNGLDRKVELRAFDGRTVLVTGAQGMLGSAFVEILQKLVPGAKVIAPSRVDLDVTRQEQVLSLERYYPDFIFHCALHTNVDWYEDHASEGLELARRGLENVITLARRTGARIFYPQSFLIYDGTLLPIDERTEPRPLNAYGRVKWDCEQQLRQELPQSLVVRLGGLFGGREADKNFVGRIIPHMRSLICQGVDRFEVGDRVWQPSYTHDLVFNILLLLARDCEGSYCMASHGQASFFELTREIAMLLDLDAHLQVVPVLAQAMAGREKALRPVAAVMRNTALQNARLDRQRTWQSSLAEYLAQPFFQMRSI